MIEFLKSQGNEKIRHTRIANITTCFKRYRFVGSEGKMNSLIRIVTLIRILKSFYLKELGYEF